MGHNNGDLKILCFENYMDRVDKVDSELKALRPNENVDSYVSKIGAVKFSNGEGKVKLDVSVRGKDIYIISDVSNYSITYNMYGYTNHMSPDEHFQDIIRTISAIAGKANRVNVIMPLLYASRQHRRAGRESLDCALALRQLENLGVNSVLTFDAHDPNVQNATPKGSFDTIFPVYAILKEFIKDNIDNIDKEKMVVVSPDAGAMQRVIQYASMLGLDASLFFKRRDYTKVVNGKNPIIAHDYMGPDVKNLDALIVDDMIASGESMLDICTQLKARGAKNMFIIATFAFFTEGTAKFDKLYEEGVIKRVYTTNAGYIPEEIKKKPWLKVVDLTRFLALIIHTLNEGGSLSPLMSSSDKIQKLLKKL